MPIHGKQHPDCQRKPINYDRYKCATRKREKETGGGICFQFPPSGRRILLFMAGRGGFFFLRRDGAEFFFFRGGTGRFVCFFEAGRGGFYFIFDGTRRGGVFFFFSVFILFSTGRDGAVFFFFFRGPGRDGCFWRWQFFWRDGAKSLHRPAKGGLNRPASRPCKALVFCLLAGLRMQFRVLGMKNSVY